MASDTAKQSLSAYDSHSLPADTGFYIDNRRAQFGTTVGAAQIRCDDPAAKHAFDVATKIWVKSQPWAWSDIYALEMASSRLQSANRLITFLPPHTKQQNISFWSFVTPRRLVEETADWKYPFDGKLRIAHNVKLWRASHRIEASRWYLRRLFYKGASARKDGRVIPRGAHFVLRFVSSTPDSPVTGFAEALSSPKSSQFQFAQSIALESL